MPSKRVRFTEKPDELIGSPSQPAARFELPTKPSSGFETGESQKHSVSSSSLLPAEPYQPSTGEEKSDETSSKTVQFPDSSQTSHCGSPYAGFVSPNVEKEEQTENTWTLERWKAQVARGHEYGRQQREDRLAYLGPQPQGLGITYPETYAPDPYPAPNPWTGKGLNRNSYVPAQSNPNPVSLYQEHAASVPRHAHSPLGCQSLWSPYSKFDSLPYSCAARSLWDVDFSEGCRSPWLPNPHMSPPPESNAARLPWYAESQSGSESENQAEQIALIKSLSSWRWNTSSSRSVEKRCTQEGIGPRDAVSEVGHRSDVSSCEAQASDTSATLDTDDGLDWATDDESVCAEEKAQARKTLATSRIPILLRSWFRGRRYIKLRVPKSRDLAFRANRNVLAEIAVNGLPRKSTARAFHLPICCYSPMSLRMPKGSEVRRQRSKKARARPEKSEVRDQQNGCLRPQLSFKELAMCLLSICGVVILGFLYHVFILFRLRSYFRE